MAMISKCDNVIDSRDVIERINELEGERQEREDQIARQTEAKAAEIDLPWVVEFEDDADELESLLALAEEGEYASSDWKHGATLINDDYFRNYAEELAEDIGAIGRNAGWPLCYIDWEAAAHALKQDYTPVDFRGETFWTR